MALFLSQTRATQSDTLVNGDVIADLGCFTDDHAHPMVNEEAPADPRPRMDLDPRKEATGVADKAGNAFKTTLPYGVRHTVEKKRMKAGIGENDFPDVTRRRIAIEYDLDIFLERFPHDECGRDGFKTRPYKPPSIPRRPR